MQLPDFVRYGTFLKKCMEEFMDRRQRKSRESIFSAFTDLLSEKDFTQITVGEIIERADVGRATFYAHFETKDYLLIELC
jgi:AcrR family transcriptional regulator